MDRRDVAHTAIVEARTDFARRAGGALRAFRLDHLRGVCCCDCRIVSASALRSAQTPQARLGSEIFSPTSPARESRKRNIQPSSSALTPGHSLCILVHIETMSERTREPLAFDLFDTSISMA